MHTTTESSTTSHLRSVRDLLAELDNMKNKGIGARDRLEYILDSGATLVDEFHIEDAFDLEARAMNRRLASLGDMQTTLRQGQEQWRGGPLGEEVKEAAGRLLGHLDKFLSDALNKERKSEIEMLSQIWEWGPDISHIFPGLTSGRPRPKPPEIPAELQEFTKKKAALYNEVQAEFEAHPHHHPVPGWQEPPVPVEEIDRIVDDFVERNPGATLQEMTADLDEQNVKEPVDEATPHRIEGLDYEAKLKAAEDELKKTPTRKFSFVKPTPPADAQTEGTVVGTVSKDSKLRDEAWTEALREMTADEWSLVKEHKGQNSPRAAFKGSVLIWHANECEGRLELFGTGDDKTEVNLRILLRGRLYRIKERLTEDQVAKLHLDPLPFVKRCLDS